jgi:hypothetical protein
LRISATSSLRLFAARFFFATISCGLTEISPIGSKSFLQVAIGAAVRRFAA